MIKFNCNKDVEYGGKIYKSPSKLFNLEGYSLNRITHGGKRLLFSKSINEDTLWVSIVYNLKYPIIKHYKTYGLLGIISDEIITEEITNEVFIHEQPFKIVNDKNDYIINLTKSDFYSLIGFGTMFCHKESIKNKYYITKLSSTFLSKISKEFIKSESIPLQLFITEGKKIIDEDDINSRYEKYYLFFKMIDVFFKNKITY